jgi:hypothetical protein
MRHHSSIRSLTSRPPFLRTSCTNRMISRKLGQPQLVAQLQIDATVSDPAEATAQPERGRLAH